MAAEQCVGLRRAALVAAIAAAMAGCDLGPDSPRVAAVDIQSDPDTLVGTAQSVSLVATLKTADGQVVDGEVTWTSDNPVMPVLATGANSASVTWSDPDHTKAIHIANIDATAGSVTARITLVGCWALVVVAKSSGTLLVGRVVPLVATAHALRLSQTTPSANADVPIGWKSSNPDVVAISADGKANAKAVGSAVLTASACGQQDAVDVSVVSSGYSVEAFHDATDVTSSGVGLNDIGEAVGSIRSGPQQTVVANYLWKVGAARRDLGDCVPVDINESSQVLCAGVGPRIWESGAATARDTVSATARALSDDVRVALQGSTKVVRWDPQTGADELTGTPTQLRGINDAGWIVGSHHFLYPFAAVWQSDGARTLSSFGRNSRAEAINDAGDIVGTSDCMSVFGQVPVAVRWRHSTQWSPEQLRPAARQFCNDVASTARDINAAGTIVGDGSQGAFVAIDGRVSLLSHIVSTADWTIESAVRVNSGGQILAQGRRSGSAQSVALLLTPPAAP